MSSSTRRSRSYPYHRVFLVDQVPCLSSWSSCSRSIGRERSCEKDRPLRCCRCRKSPRIEAVLVELGLEMTCRRGGRRQ
jgi:hypothetical protein